MAKSKSYDEEISATQLAKRWHSKKLVEKYAPKVHRTYRNYYGLTATMYLLRDVERKEKGKKFKEEQAAANKRSEKMKEVYKVADETLRKRTIERYLSELEVEMPTTKEELYQLAVEHYNYISEWGCTEDIGKLSNDFLNRIAKNYVRHICSNYEEILESHKRNRHSEEAYNTLKSKINGMVSQFLKTAS